MSNEPLSAEDLLKSYRDVSFIPKPFEPDQEKWEIKYRKNEADRLAEAKRYLAEAIEWIISYEDGLLSKIARELNSNELKKQAFYEYRLRAEQRKRLAEWLGEKTE